MIRRLLGATVTVGIVCAVALSCTNDFDSLRAAAGKAGNAGTSGDGGGSAGTPTDAGAGGSAADSGAGGANGGQGGIDGSAGGDAGGAPSTGGASGGSPNDSGATGGNAGSGGCLSTDKMCAGKCAAPTDPSTGCASASCDPCVLPNATATCLSGACAVGTCAPGFGDCDKSAAAPGCERVVHDDLSNCGACDRTCSTAGVAGLACKGSTCTSSCELGKANCSHPSTGTDDGCETTVTSDSRNCGGCNNACSNGKSCINGLCNCNGSSRHCVSVGSTAGVLCEASGVCSCEGMLCAVGETCKFETAKNVCSCNGGAACTSGQTCCQTPAGCFDLQSDAANCGGCGHACTVNFACVAGVCECDSDGDCSAGTNGTCNSGVCTCGTNTCKPGQRCLPNGSCG